MIETFPGSVTIGGIAFDDVTYDREGDVLYLWSGTPRKPASDDASPEGHYLQFGARGELIAMTIVNARWILEQDGKVVVDLVDPHGLHLADALPKLQGLALYAEKHAKAYRRIESITEAKGKLRVLDLTNSDVRKGIATAKDAMSLFSGVLASDY